MPEMRKGDLMDSDKPGRQGWGFPGGSRKAHYFIIEPGRIIGDSLCGMWGFYGGQTEQGNDDSPDNCSACKGKLKRIRDGRLKKK